MFQRKIWTCLKPSAYRVFPGLFPTLILFWHRKECATLRCVTGKGSKVSTARWEDRQPASLGRREGGRLLAGGEPRLILKNH